MGQRTCTEPDCDRPYLALGLCSKHYNRQRATATTCSVDGCPGPREKVGKCMTHYREAREALAGPCSVPDCTQPHKIRGMCQKHYTRWSRNGTTARKTQQAAGLTCTEEGCDRETESLGLCGLHYARQRTTRLGDCTKPDCDRPQHAAGLCGRHYGRTRTPRPPCAVARCGKPQHSMRLCSTHYAEWAAKNLPQCTTEGCSNHARSSLTAHCESCYRRILVMGRSIECREDDCTSPVATAGRCTMHYQRWLMAQRPPCSEDDCDKPVKAGGLCAKHYKRQRMTPDAARRSHLRRTFGITPEQYEAMHAAQGGRCAICRRDEPKAVIDSGTPWSLAVDHDHTTGRVRGLLCSTCNTGIGHLKDDVALLVAAIEYLKNPPASLLM